MRAPFVLLVASLACVPDSQPGNIAPAAVLVRPDAMTIPAGSSVQLAAEVHDLNGQPIGRAPLLFASRDPSVAEVSSRGLVTAPGKIGSTVIAVSSGAISTTARVTVSAGSPERLEVRSGDAQEGRVGSALPDPVIVRVEDARGNPVPGATVSFRAAAGRIDPAETRTGADGAARAIWTTGERAGAQEASASCAGAAATFHARAIAGAPMRLTGIGAAPAEWRVGTAAPARVLAADAHGNPVAGARVLWRIVRGGGSVDRDSTTSDAQGIAATSWSSGTAAGRNVLRASLAPAPEVFVELTADTVAGPPAKILAEKGSRQTGRSGAGVPTSPTARVVDAEGNPIAGVPVKFSVVEGGGSIEHPVATTGEGGEASAGKWTLGQRGVNSVEAAVTGSKVVFIARAR